MADEYPWVDLSDEDIPSPSRQSGLGWSISNLVNIMCSLKHLTEETVTAKAAKRFNDILAQNDILYQNKRYYIPGQIAYLQKSHSIKRQAHHIILPPFPLKRRWSELDLPTFMTSSSKGNKAQEVNDKSSEGFSRFNSPVFYISAHL